MNSKKILLGSLLAGGLLALARLAFAHVRFLKANLAILYLCCIGRLRRGTEAPAANPGDRAGRHRGRPDCLYARLWPGPPWR